MIKKKNSNNDSYIKKSAVKGRGKINKSSSEPF